MSHQSQRVGATESLLFVDGFAGPGSYLGGEDGSPILAIKSAIEHAVPLPIPISFLFIEEDRERCEILGGAIQKYDHDIRNSARIKPPRIEHGDCESVVNSLLDEWNEAGQQVGPALFFLDQFGYSDVSMDLVTRIMSCPRCEVFSYLNWDHMHRFLTDQSKWASLNRTFGGEEWRPSLELELKERASFILHAYRTALMTKARSRYVWSFTMADESDSPLYWLFFCTNSLRGTRRDEEGHVQG